VGVNSADVAQRSLQSLHGVKTSTTISIEKILSVTSALWLFIEKPKRYKNS
jgi:hypothetical protein